MHLLPRALLATAIAAALLLAGCSAGGENDAGEGSTTTASETTPTSSDEGTSTTTDSTATTTAGGDDDAELCAALQEISDYDKEIADAIEASTPWNELQQLFVDSTPEVLGAYDDAIDATDDESLKSDLETLRSFTEPTGDLARESESMVDLGEKLNEQPNLMESGRAGLRLDTYSRETCGFGTSTAGEGAGS